MFVKADSVLQAERIANRYSWDATSDMEQYFEAATTIEIADPCYDEYEMIFTENGETFYEEIAPTITLGLYPSYVFVSSAASPSNF
jgi:hypothetical protein